MSHAPRRVLAFLSGIDLSGYSRARVAHATKLSEATVKRALSTLVEIGAIRRERGGCKTPSKITVLMTMQEFLTHKPELTHKRTQIDPQAVEIDPQAGALRVKEKYKNRLAERKPPHVENKQPAFEDFVREQTRFEIGGRVADEGTVKRIAALLGDQAGYESFRAHWRDWCRRNTPRTWGIVVVKAAECRGEVESARSG